MQINYFIFEKIEKYKVLNRLIYYKFGDEDKIDFKAL